MVGGGRLDIIGSTVPPPLSYPPAEPPEGAARRGAAGAGQHRFASVGIAQVGTNLTEQIVTSGKPSRWYKALPGATVDGINENGVACNINVTSGAPAWRTNATDKALHPLAAVRWILDSATNAQSAAEYIAANIRFPQGWEQNFHYMIADERATYIVENGEAFNINIEDRAVLTNTLVYFPPYSGSGVERFVLLDGGANITNAWYTNAYRRETNPPWVSDLADVLAYTNEIFDAWASHPKEYFRNKTNGGEPWWQTVHTSVYDLTNLTLRVCVQEQDDWYTFAVPPPLSAAGADSYTRAETDAKLAEKADMLLPEQVEGAGTVPDAILALGLMKAEKSDIPVISASDPTFSNEVAAVARTVTPQPSPTLRVYDEVRACWWIGRMVNGVINWEVE